MKRRLFAFTLIELLVVVVLLGILAGIGFRSLLAAGVTQTDALRTIASIDAEARLLARRHGPLAMNLHRDQHRNRVTITVGETDRSYPIPAAITLRTVHGETRTIALDRLGQSTDYTAATLDGSRVLHVAGLTGWSWIDDR